MSQQLTCPACGATYSGAEKFCFRDGARLPRANPSHPTQPVHTGRVVAGRFRLGEVLGTGGMGMVYRATHTVLDRPFAIKLLRSELINNRRAVERFFHEARATSRVDHPNIVSIYDCGIDQGEPYLAMEYVAGVSLHRSRQDNPGGTLPVREAVDIVLQVVSALSHAHERGVVHRDIKPENVLLTCRAGQADWVKVLDFGVARIVGQPRVTAIGDGLVGTPEFMAPELLVEEGQAGPPVDLYAVGMLLHDILTGDPPFTGTMVEVIHAHLEQVAPLLSERRKDARIPPDLDLLCARLLDKDPQRRPSAEETLAQLGQIRGLLPPRSLRSLLLAETLILSAGPSGRASSLLETVPIFVPLELTVLSAGPQRTTVLSTLLQDLGGAEEERKRLREDLSQEVLALCGQVWPDQVPAEAEELQRLFFAREAEQRGLEARLHELLSRREEEQSQAQRQREQARQEIVELRVQQQLLGLDKDVGNSRRAASLESYVLDEPTSRLIRQKEQTYGQAQDALEAPQPEVARVCAALSQCQGQRDRALTELSHLLLQTTSPLALLGEFRRLQKQLSHFETLLATLSLVPGQAVPA